MVGGKETTKVKLLKAITKLNYDCDVIPGTYNVNGTITFINPATGATADVTNACCEDLNENWTFVQTNNTTGVGTCYHNSNTYTSTTEVDSNWTPGGQVAETGGNQMMMMPLLPIQGSTTQIINRAGQQQSQETTVYLECITKGTTAENLRQKNDLLALHRIIPDRRGLRSVRERGLPPQSGDRASGIHQPAEASVPERRLPNQVPRTRLRHILRRRGLL